MARHRLTRSGPPLYPEHPESEHRWRLERARTIMREEQLDALLLARNVNVFYLSGSRFVFVGMDAPVALAPQSTAIVTQDADIYCQRFGPFDSDDVSLQTTVSESIELYDDELELVDILRDYGIGTGSRIGTEWGPGLCVGINPIKFLTLKRRIEDELGAAVVDGTTAVWRITAVKSPLEIERMRVAVAAAAAAMERIYDVIELGMNELDVARLARQFMLEAGADSVSHAQVMAHGDSGVNLMSCDAVDRPIGRGWVHLDLGAKFRRYGSDINRGLFLGREPTREEQKLYAVRKGIDELLDRTIKPGVSIDDTLGEMKAYTESEGCILQEIGGVAFGGHGIGLEPYQRPNLIPATAQPEFQNEAGDVLFEPGMMFTYEMAVQLPGHPSLPFFNIEDDVVVTESGVENMNAMLSRELRVKV